MEALRECELYCPYCAAPITVLIDTTQAQQRYIEDCEVCCAPMVIHVDIAPDGSLSLQAWHENEVTD